MASIEAAINVVVKGSNAVNRLIENVSQLQSAVDRINSKTLDIAPKALQQRASGLTSRMEGSLARINDLGGSRNRILSQQRQAVERLTQAQLSQQRALERAADAEKELSRLAKRDEIGSKRTAALKQSLRDSAAEAERFGDEMSNAASSAQELQARIGAIGRATKNAISSAGALINVNQTLSASNAVKALAEEYNRYGDSLRRSAREAQLSDRTLPKQIDTFNQFTRQIEQAESSLQSLRSQLRQLGSMETMIQVPANQVNPQELLTPAGLREAAERAAQIEQAQQENELRQQRNARRSEVASEISTQESNLVDLERRTAALGKQIAANQDKVAQSMKKRDPGSQTGLSASLNQIQAQAEALALVANNSAVASSAFNKFTVASQVASVKLARAQQSSFAALAAGFSGQAEAVPTGLGGYQADGARSLVAQAVADIPSLTRSEAAINQHISLLSQLKSIVPLLSDEYTVLGDAIDRLNNELQDSQRAGAQRASEAGLTGGTVAQQEKGRAQGPISLLPQFSIESEAKRLRFNKAVEDSFETQSQLIDKINSSSLQVADKEKLRLRANEALNTLLDSSSKTRLQDSKQMVKSIDNELSGLQKAQNYRDALIKKAKSLITSETNRAQTSEGLTKRLDEARSRVEESANANLIDQLQKKKILANIDSAALAIQEKQLKIASALTGDIDKQRISAERITRATKDQSFGVLGTSFVPRGGNLPSGAIPGSPAFERLLQASGGVYGPALPPSPNPLKTGAVSPVGGEFAIKNALMSSEVIQAKLLKLKSQGIPVDQELLDIEKARAAAASDNFENTAKTLKQLVEANALGGRRASIGNQIVGAQKEELNNQEKIAKQLKHLQGLHRSFTAEQRKGVVFGQELADLQDLLTNGSTSNLAANKQNVDALKKNIDYMRDMLGIRISQAKEAGTYTGGSQGKAKTAEAIEKARTSALSNALGIQGQINSLEGAGIDLANEKLTIETAIARLKEIQGQASEKEVENLKQQIADTSNLVREAKNMRPGEGSTFAPALSAEEVRNRYNKIVSNLDAVIPGTANAGQNVVDTLASELSAGVGKVLSSGIELGMATIKGLRKALKMQSPSRVMVEIALNVVDTYVATLKAAIPQVEAVSKKLADASAQAMQQPASSEFGGLPKEAVRKITPKTSSFYIESAATNLVAYAANLGEIADLSKEEVLNRARAAITSKGAYPITENIPGMDWNKLQNELFTIPGEMAELARKTFRDFYGVNSKLLPEASTGVTDNAETAAANLATAEQEAKQLNQAILELVNGFDSLVKSVRAAATPLQDTKGIAGPGSVNKTPSQVAMEIAAENDRINAEAARRYAAVKSEFERSVTEAARIDEEQRKRAIYDSFAASREQAIFDAEAAAGFTSRQLSEPAEEAAFDGGNKVKSAIEQIFDRIASRLKSLAGSFGGMGGGGGGGGRGASGGRSDSAGGASDPSGPVSQTAEAMSMLGNISRLTNNQLEELEQQLAALRNMADATGTEFKQLTKDLAAIGREQEKRDPNADMLTASVGPRTANAISEGLIGGAFPLLFGQGLGSSIFGGLGGAAGGFAGGGLGFGLSLIGTAIGTAVDEAENLDKALVKVNAGVKGVGSTSGDVEKLASSLGIAKEEAVKLLDQFKQFGSAKIRSDVASVFGGGREAIFEKLESSLKERDVLDAIIESRKTLTNQEASGLLNVLKAEGSLKAQLAIREAILRVAENEVLAEKERVTLMDRILSGFASGEGARIVTPEDIAKDRRNKAQAELNRAREARRKSIEEAIKESQRFFKEVDNLSEKYKKDDDRKRLAEQYLAAIEAREDGLSNVRIQYEEKIAEIRKGAIEAAARIEEELADKRKQLEREIDDVRRGREDRSVDLELRLRELRGEDQSVISAERDAIRAQREERDARIELERKINDDQQQQERTIAEFRKGIARQIQDANLASARAIGEVQKNFAKATSKIIDEGTGKSAKRLEISGRIVSLEIERAAFNTARSFSNLVPIGRPMASGSELLYPSGTPNRSLPPEYVPPGFLDIDKRLRDLYRQLGRTSQAGAGGRLISMSGGEQQLGAGEQLAFDASKLPRSLGEIASIGVGSVITPEMTVPRIRGVEQTTETREQLRTETEKDIDAQKRGNVLVNLAKAKENILEMNRSLAKQGELFNLELKYLESGIEPSLARQLATLEAIREEGVKDLNNRRASLLARGNDRALVESRFEMESEALNEIYNKNVKITTELEKQNNLLKFSYKGRMGQLSREMNDLVNTGNIAISAAGAISGAFSDSFKSIVSGSDSAENALANLFQRTADHFIEMATQIIAKQLEMELVGVAFNFFGSLLGGGARPTGLNPAELNLGDMGKYADSSFAMGGVFSSSVVDSPTLFKFADGGALRNGVMGEAGPEAVMPLTRGPGGSLGVRAYLADSRAALDGGKTQQDEEAFADNRQAIAATSTTQRERYIESVLTSGPQSMEIKYSRVNSGDLPFVTEEDMLQASRAAAQEGAKMGEKRALVALRNNPSTRRSVGI